MPDEFILMLCYGGHAMIVCEKGDSDSRSLSNSNISNGGAADPQSPSAFGPNLPPSPVFGGGGASRLTAPASNSTRSTSPSSGGGRVTDSIPHTGVMDILFDAKSKDKSNKSKDNNDSTNEQKNEKGEMNPPLARTKLTSEPVTKAKTIKDDRARAARASQLGVSEAELLLVCFASPLHNLMVSAMLMMLVWNVVMHMV
jgi:hypothetical protein